MIGKVHRELWFDVIAGPSAGAQGNVLFLYRADVPHSIHLMFPGSGHSLMVFRDLLDKGVIDGAGDGDIVIEPVSEGVTFTLTEFGYRVLLFDADELADALAETWDVVPHGDEAEFFNMDMALGDLLKAGA